MTGGSFVANEKAVMGKEQNVSKPCRNCYFTTKEGARYGTDL